ncbi:MAG: magnesium transporter CorA family protein [Hydrogenophaga sp.]|uniref:magnesium transporter CorA family protein n=1 Tax=Hydrogenophaga sp. TaxID=1904254 RepID=UPI002731FED8|nr:magnesium transporter CorA family protein [Hydrogenophaga sp.]MDP2163509.1 magnesium transporter CorA family protein [Hydrogenophaga sp.]
MRVFSIQSGVVRESAALPEAPPDGGFLWLACERPEFEQAIAAIQASLLASAGATLVDLHVSDLLNQQLPSRFDYISSYDLLVFRRLAASHPAAVPLPAGAAASPAHRPSHPPRGGLPVLRRIDTSPVGFALFDHVLLTVHPAGCSVLTQYATRLVGAGTAASRAAGAQLPTGAAELMLRIVNLMVDGYLELRRDLTRQLDHWQTELLHPQARFTNWNALLQARTALHQLDQICEDQRSAIQDWIEALASWDMDPDIGAGQPLGHVGGQRGLELLRVRSRDVLEHIERVVTHVRRLEQNAETAVQMHFSVQSNRTNDIMRTLTALTAIFLPLNLIAGIFGMNFEFIPLLHKESGFWWAMGTMVLIASLLSGLFWRKRYLARSGR